MLGGSFDPVHHGHLIAARSLRETLELDRVLLIPAGQQPFKRDGHGAGAVDRATMVELAIRGEVGLGMDRMEVERAGPSYTVDTLATLKELCPGAEITLLLGADAAREFPAWRSADRIRELARVMAFTRAGSAVTGVEVPVVEIPAVEISSTDVRARVREGRSIRYLVPDAVAAYVAEHRLYQDGQDHGTIGP